MSWFQEWEAFKWAVKDDSMGLRDHTLSQPESLRTVYAALTDDGWAVILTGFGPYHATATVNIDDPRIPQWFYQDMEPDF